MSISTILAISESIGINDQRFVGQMVSRNQRISTSEVMTVVPFGFELRPMNYLRYSQNRGLLNSLRIPDKALIQYLSFANTGWENYIQYQGVMTPIEISACTWEPQSLNTILIMGNLPDVAPDAVLLKVGDFCQVGLYSYIVTADVLRGEENIVYI